jgi:prepilin-type N-terminal cleavage/methylation domain-containing protein
MYFCIEQSGSRRALKPSLAFTLIEVVISIAILALVMGGLIYGYVQANWSAEWSSMSLAAQAYASEGAEQARAADWRPNDYPPTDELTNGTIRIYPNCVMDNPSSSSTSTHTFATNIVTISGISTNPPLKLIRSDCIWTFPKDQLVFTNTVMMMRTADQ